MDEIEEVLCDPAASFWLKDALRCALGRDPVDAARDAELLSRLLEASCAFVLAMGKIQHGCA